MWVIHCDGCPSYDDTTKEAQERQRYREEQEEKIERSIQKLRTGNSDLARAFQAANRKP